jgi:hypothetical protein
VEISGLEGHWGVIGGSSVEEGVGQPARVPYVVMEWMATITGDHVGYPGFQDLGNFSPRRNIFFFWGGGGLLKFSLQY